MAGRSRGEQTQPEPMQPFRFAVHTGVMDPAVDVIAVARRAEELGYHAVYVTDHLGRGLSPIAVMGAIAAVTREVRIGAYVFANDFRHPLILAREAAAIDRLSGGRLDLGLGAGWMRSDYRQLGMPYDPPALRIDRLEESLDIVLRLLAGEEVTHDGRFYRLDRARIGPPPVQQPFPRLMLGGGGPRLLRLAARRADIVGFAPQMSPAGRPMLRASTDAALRERVEIVRRAAGERFERLELNAFVADAGVAGGSQSPSASLAALVKSAGPALAGGSPYVLYGTLDSLSRSLLRRRDETGVHSYGIPVRAMEAFAPLVTQLRDR